MFNFEVLVDLKLDGYERIKINFETKYMFSKSAITNTESVSGYSY